MHGLRRRSEIYRQVRQQRLSQQRPEGLSIAIELMWYGSPGEHKCQYCACSSLVDLREQMASPATPVVNITLVWELLNQMAGNLLRPSYHHLQTEK